MKPANSEYRSPHLDEILPICTPVVQEVLIPAAIAIITTIATLGILFCLFDQTQCVRVYSTGEANIQHGFRGCAPDSLQ
ncbi:MAG: hypothetical protein IGR76_13520 [Synechococcales cyanobacterium T60_A2020_003]|nr:hypothetical protein [Synechococcales cyanobacterium T60_A2020_003]